MPGAAQFFLSLVGLGREELKAELPGMLLLGFHVARLA
jgi:hypothetical protein